MAIIRRNKIVKSAVTGFRVVVVVGEDPDNKVETVDVLLPGIGGEPTPEPQSMTLPLRKVKPNGNKRYVYAELTFSGGDPVGKTYNMTSTMKDASNNPVGVSLTSSPSVQPDGDPRLRSIFIKQLDATNFLVKVVIVGDDTNEIAKVEVAFDGELNFGLPDPVPAIIKIDSPSVVNGGKKVFKYSTLTFPSDPNGAVDQVYTLNVMLKDAEGTTLSSTEEDVIVEGLDIA